MSETDRQRRYAARHDIPGDPFTPSKTLMRSPPKRVNGYEDVLAKIGALIPSIEPVDVREKIKEQFNILSEFEDDRMSAGLEARLSIEMEQMRRYLSEEIKTMCKEIPSKQSYAEKVKVKNMTVDKDRKVVLIYPKSVDGPEESVSKITEATLRKVVAPSNEGLQVSNVRGIRKGGLAVVVNGDDSVKKLQEASALKEGGFKVVEGKGRNPRIQIYGVPEDLPEKEVSCSVWKQNFIEMDETSFEKSFRLVYSSKSQGKKNWVATCNPKMRELLINKGRVYIDWFSCKVKDFISVPRCYKCHGYGHMAGNCKSKLKCGKCGEEGHEFKSCKSQGPNKCANCKSFGKPHDHDVRDPKCPCFLRAMEVEVKRTNYGK